MKYKTTGRVITSDKGVALLSSADSFEFRANCRGRVSVRIYAESTPEAGEADLYFTGYTDGVRCEERYHIIPGDNEIVLCEDIPDGIHTFKIVRQNEWGHGNIYVRDILLTGELLAPPKDKELFIEFIGDSLTTGYGNLADVVSDTAWGGAPIYQDATRAFPYMVGEELDADISVAAIQGIGTACGGWDFTMNDIYDCYPRVNEKDYSYIPERTADVVVILLLGNDKDYYKDLGMTFDDVLAKAKELCLMARAKHPDSIVIFSPADYLEPTEIMVETQLGGADNDFYTVLLPMDNKGKGGHPSAEGHIRAKNILVPLIRELIERKRK